MMAMVVMTMTKMAMAKMTMTMTMPVVPVMAVAAVPAMTTVTVASGESLTRDGQGSSGQRQSCNRRCNDRLELRHGRLSSVGQSVDRSTMIYP
jgi:hypothetical protein